MEWHWHHLNHMQIICTSLQSDNHASTSLFSFYRLHTLAATQPTPSKHWRTKQFKITCCKLTLCYAKGRSFTSLGSYQYWAVCQLLRVVWTVLFDRSVYEGPEPEKFLDHLDARIMSHNKEIERMCNHHYQGFIESVHSLLQVRSDVEKLKVLQAACMN